MARGSRRRRDDDSLNRFARRCAAALEALYGGPAQDAPDGNRPEIYTAALRHVVAMVSCLICAERIPDSSPASRAVRAAAGCLYEALGPKPGSCEHYAGFMQEAAELSGIGIFELPSGNGLGEPAINSAAVLLLQPDPEAAIDGIYFQAMPLSWLGHAYQRMLALRPSQSGGWLEKDRSHRKGEGVYFTPPWLVKYVVEEALSPLLETGSPENLLVLDPAMGGGDFLSAVVEHLSDSVPDGRAAFAASCVYGVDKDPLAVDIARFGVWAASGFADGIAERLKSNLICGDAVGANGIGIHWSAAFPEAFGVGGFDAVVGNPPYIAAKNSPEARAESRGRGQSDFYLFFLDAAINGGLVKPGGVLSMVLPDPMLVRANAADIRRKLVSDWTILSILHISEAFEDAVVANAVPTCRNMPPVAPTFPVTRIESAAERRAFVLRPRDTARRLAKPMRREVALAQKRCELFYLLEEGRFGDIARSVHGDDLALSHYEPPFVPLESLNVSAVFRGEEVGKAAISGEEGDLPVLLGGQSIQPYEIIWEGRRAATSWVKKPLARYQSTKVLVQKSAAHVIAAIDQVTRRHPGYVFPQSVYGIELSQPGMHELYLLCILNSRVMNDYVWRTATGYKFLHPQLEIEDIRALPIRGVEFTSSRSERESGLAEGVRLFDTESLRAGSAVPFVELDNFVAACLTGDPERSDVVHDLLVHLGRLIVDLTEQNRSAPSAEATQRLEMARAAVETVVTRLYSSEPSQMGLAL